jgi:hypothetical protein
MDYEEILEDQIEELEDYEQDLEKEIADRKKNAKKYLEKYRMQRKKAMENLKEQRKICKELRKEEKRIKNELEIIRGKAERAGYKCISYIEDCNITKPNDDLKKLKKRLEQAKEVKQHTYTALEVHLDR